MSYTIYALVDSRDDELFYIGISKHAHSRKNQHKATRKSNNYLTANRIEEIVADSGELKMMMIEITETRKQAEEREWFWISCYQAAGYQLTNHMKRSQEFDGDPIETIKQYPLVPMLTPAQLNRIRRFVKTEWGWIEAHIQRYLIEKGVMKKNQKQWWKYEITPLGKQTIARYDLYKTSMQS